MFWLLSKGFKHTAGFDLAHFSFFDQSELDVSKSFPACTFPLPAASFLGTGPPSAQALPSLPVFCTPREPASLSVLLIERRPNSEADRVSEEAIGLFVQGQVANQGRERRWGGGWMRSMDYSVTEIISNLENNPEPS